MIFKNLLAALPGENEFRKVDIQVTGSILRAISPAGTLKQSFPEEEYFDGEGLMAFPGAIDPHVHFDEPGFTHREDFFHGTCEAARGGVTTVIDMPCTSLPPVTSTEALKNKLEIIQTKAVVDYALYGGLHGAMSKRQIEDIVQSLKDYVVGFKTYFLSGMDTFPTISHDLFREAIKACSAVSRPLLLHAEDDKVVAQFWKHQEMESAGAEPTWKDYYATRPMEAEIAACRHALELAAENAATLHVVHVGTDEAAHMLKKGGASCETCTHYLAFDETDFERLGASLKTAPPVKEPTQKALLWKSLADGTISFITSDHAGAPDYEKFTGNPLTAYGGIPGTGTIFPYLLSEGLFAGRLSLKRFLEATSSAAARRYGLDDRKGSLEPGKDADLILVDPDATTHFLPENMFSKSKITPFAGMRFAGRIVGTFVRGELVYGTSRLLGGNIPHSIRKHQLSASGTIVAAQGYGNNLQWRKK